MRGDVKVCGELDVRVWGRCEGVRGDVRVCGEM